MQSFYIIIQLFVLCLVSFICCQNGRVEKESTLLYTQPYKNDNTITRRLTRPTRTRRPNGNGRAMVTTVKMNSTDIKNESSETVTRKKFFTIKNLLENKTLSNEESSSENLNNSANFSTVIFNKSTKSVFVSNLIPLNTANSTISTKLLHTKNNSLIEYSNVTVSAANTTFLVSFLINSTKPFNNNTSTRFMDTTIDSSNVTKLVTRSLFTIRFNSTPDSFLISTKSPVVTAEVSKTSSTSSNTKPLTLTAASSSSSTSTSISLLLSNTTYESSLKSSTSKASNTTSSGTSPSVFKTTTSRSSPLITSFYTSNSTTTENSSSILFTASQTSSSFQLSTKSSSSTKLLSSTNTVTYSYISPKGQVTPLLTGLNSTKTSIPPNININTIIENFSYNKTNEIDNTSASYKFIDSQLSTKDTKEPSYSLKNSTVSKMKADSLSTQNAVSKPTVIYYTSIYNTSFTKPFSAPNAFINNNSSESSSNRTKDDYILIDLMVQQNIFSKTNSTSRMLTSLTNSTSNYTKSNFTKEYATNKTHIAAYNTSLFTTTRYFTVSNLTEITAEEKMLSTVSTSTGKFSTKNFTSFTPIQVIYDSINLTTASNINGTIYPSNVSNFYDNKEANKSLTENSTRLFTTTSTSLESKITLTTNRTSNLLSLNLTTIPNQNNLTRVMTTVPTNKTLSPYPTNVTETVLKSLSTASAILFNASRNFTTNEKSTTTYTTTLGTISNKTMTRNVTTTTSTKSKIITVTTTTPSTYTSTTSVTKTTTASTSTFVTTTSTTAKITTTATSTTSPLTTSTSLAATKITTAKSVNITYTTPTSRTYTATNYSLATTTTTTPTTTTTVATTSTATITTTSSTTNRTTATKTTTSTTTIIITTSTRNIANDTKTTTTTATSTTTTSTTRTPTTTTKTTTSTTTSTTTTTTTATTTSTTSTLTRSDTTTSKLSIKDANSTTLTSTTTTNLITTSSSTKPTSKLVSQTSTSSKTSSQLNINYSESTKSTIMNSTSQASSQKTTSNTIFNEKTKLTSTNLQTTSTKLKFLSEFKEMVTNVVQSSSSTTTTKKLESTEKLATPIENLITKANGNVKASNQTNVNINGITKISKIEDKYTSLLPFNESIKEIILLTSALTTAILGSCFFIFLIWFCVVATKKRKNRRIGKVEEILENSSVSSAESKTGIAKKITVDAVPKSNAANMFQSKSPNLVKIPTYPLMEKESIRLHKDNKIESFELGFLKPDDITNRESVVSLISKRENDKNLEGLRAQVLNEIKSTRIAETSANFENQTSVESNNESRPIRATRSDSKAGFVNETFISDDEMTGKEKTTEAIFEKEESSNKSSLLQTIDKQDINKTANNTAAYSEAIISASQNLSVINIPRKVSAATETDNQLLNILPNLKVDKEIQFTQNEVNEDLSKSKTESSANKTNTVITRVNPYLNPIRNAKSGYPRLRTYDPKNFVEKNIVRVSDNANTRKLKQKEPHDSFTPKPTESLIKSKSFLPSLDQSWKN